MTLGLCLLALAAAARGGSDPALAGQGQSQSQKQKPAQKGKPGPPKKIEYPPPKQPDQPAQQPLQRFRNLALTTAQRVDALVDALTPEERPAFLCVKQKAIDRLGIAAFDWADRTPDPRFPRAIGIGASFDLDLASRIATQQAKETSAKALFSPIEVVGDPRWGMSGDTFGEDPLLVGSMAATQVAEFRRLKRLAEIGELGLSGRISEPPGPTEIAFSQRELGDVVLEPAKMAVAADVSLGLWIDPFARVSDAPVFEAKFLDSIVRKEWGLTGPVISGSGVGSPPPAPPHSGTEIPNKGGSAVDALLNGCDLFTEDDCKMLVDAAKTNADVAKAIERAIRRVLEAEMRVGLFDPVPANAKPTSAGTGAAAATQTGVALLQARAAAESMVLLKNEGEFLPLKPGYRTVAVIGPNADNPSAMLGAAPGPSAKVITPLEAIKAAVGDKVKVLYEKGTGVLNREDLQTIPSDAFPKGLSGEYYEGTSFAGTPLTKPEDHIDLAWKGDPVEGIKAKSFSAIWTGAIVPKVSGRYGIGFTVEGAARLYIDDVLKIDDWNDGPTRTKTVAVDLTAGENSFYVIRLEYAHGAATGSGSVRLVWSPPEEEPYRAAIEAAIKSDVVILVLGLDPTLEGPSLDRRDIAMPDAQDGLLKAVAALKRPTVLVLLNGGPVSSPLAKEQIPAILEAWYPGEAGASAIADVLTGAASPTGKLPVTIYQTNAQLPPPLMVDAPRGYRYSVFRPLFAFGSGLTYTTFAYSALNAPPLVDGSKPVTVGVTVKNVGKRAGDEVVQLYVSRGTPSPGWPRIALRGFRRVHLNAGESRRVVFQLTAKDFDAVGPKGGQLRVSVGGNQPMDDQPATVSATVRVK